MQLRIGSRASSLAIAQAQIVIDSIEEQDPSIDVELVTMTTTGDRLLNKTLDKVGGKGLFVKELELALREGRVDMTAHSLKDMTMEIPEDLPVLAVSAREDPRDALVLPKGTDKLDLTKPIGCSSKRRILQFKQMHPEARFKLIRGNVQTRMRKVDSGEYAATLFAVAGLKRAGLEDRISRIFEPEEMLPAAGQGVIAVQGRKGQDTSFLEEFNDEKSWLVSAAERSFVRELDGGCSSPVAAYATLCGYEDSRITLTGLNIDKEGRPVRRTVKGDAEDGEQLGRELAISMKDL